MHKAGYSHSIIGTQPTLAPHVARRTSSSTALAPARGFASGRQTPALQSAPPRANPAAPQHRRAFRTWLTPTSGWI